MRRPTLRGLVIAAAILDFLVLSLFCWFKLAPQAAEQVYGRGLYPFIAAILGFCSDLVPFPVQWTALLLCGAALPWLVWRTWRRRHTRAAARAGAGTLSKRRGAAAGRLAARVFVVLSALAAWFYLSWGFNYLRPRLEETLRAPAGTPARGAGAPVFDERRVTEDAHAAVLETTLLEANRLAPAASNWAWDDVAPELEARLDAVQRAYEGRTVAGARRIKRFWPDPLSALPFSGVTWPWLAEAHVARDLFPFEVPLVAAHEKAHLRGRADEGEAGFFAYAACAGSARPALRYAAHFHLLGHLARGLAPRGRAALAARFSPALRAHFALTAARARAKSAVLADVTRVAYDAYLKSNAVREGLANYGRVARLVLGFDAWRTR